MNDGIAEEKNYKVLMFNINSTEDANSKGFLMLQCYVRLLIDFAYRCEINIGLSFVVIISANSAWHCLL